MAVAIIPLYYIIATATVRPCVCVGGVGGLSTFPSIRELLSGLVSINTTQILQARKQMECDNNKH